MVARTFEDVGSVVFNIFFSDYLILNSIRRKGEILCPPPRLVPPNFLRFRQLWVRGRASSRRTIKMSLDYTMYGKTKVIEFYSQKFNMVKKILYPVNRYGDKKTKVLENEML